MTERQDKPDGPGSADEFGTLAPAVQPRPGPVNPQAQETIVQASGTGAAAGNTTPADMYATMAREIPAGASDASLPPSGAAIAGLPFDRVGEYDILDKIGHGGMGLVLKARQRRLKRIVALKLIKVGQLAEEQEVARFMVEARAAAHLKHPNIVAVYDVGEHAGSPFFTMEFVEGQSLHKLISERPLQPQRAAIIIRKLALAVAYAHEAGILHRDLKPQNILLDKYEEPKITDFGLATNAQENSQLTATGTVLGTPSYMPPEQARGKHEEMGKWSDVYSLGATFYETLVGRPPFTAATLGETLQQVMTVEPVSPRRLNPAIPRDLETICLKCLEKNPARRYQTGQELADELQRFLDDRPILARPTSRTEKFVRWCRRNPVIAGAIAAVSVAAVFAIVSLWVGLSQALAAKKESDETTTVAMEMLDKLLLRISGETLFNQPGMLEVRAGIQKDAIASYEVLLTKLEQSQRMPEKIAVVKSSMGVMKLQLGEQKEGIDLVNEATSILEKMHRESPQNPKLLTYLSSVKTELGKFYFDQRNYKLAAEPLKQALELRKERVLLEPNDIEASQLLANAEMNLGTLHDTLHEIPAALALLESADKRRSKLLEKSPQNSGVLRDRAKGLSNIGLLQAQQGKLNEAEQYYEQARKAFETLDASKDRQLDDFLNLGICWKYLGDFAAIRNGKDDLSLAIRRYIESIKVLEQLVNSNSSMRIYRGTLGRTRLNLAQLELRKMNYHESFAILTVAFDELQKLRIEDPAYEKFSAKAVFEMLRLKKWNKLNNDDQQELANWSEFAATENGKPWMQELERQVESAPEYPPALQLEESELFSPSSGAPR
ncbi:MAG: protein kinase domain-containing protein [Pirellulaceae bacterium]